MTLKIISAQEVIFTGEVTSVTMPGSMGEFTVLKNHASLLSTLEQGIIRYVDDAGSEHSQNIGAGIADINHNVITICVY